MNRASFGDWGAGLDSTRFAAAVAALGVTNDKREVHALDAVDRAWAEPSMQWRSPSGSYDGHDPQELAVAWLANLSSWRETHPPVVAGQSRPLKTELPRMAVDWRTDEDPTWLVAQLSADRIGPLSVHLSGMPHDGSVHWSWPLEIGLLDDPQSEQLRRRLIAETNFSSGRFVNPRAVSGDGGICDLLLLPMPLRDAIGRVLTSGVRASCVLLLRPPADRWTVTRPLLRALQSHVGAAGIGFAPVPVGDLLDWLRTLLSAMAHDHPLDVALRLAGINSQVAPPLLLADWSLLAETRLSRVAMRLMDRAQRSQRGPLQSAAPERDVSWLNFDSEMRGASDLLRLAPEMRRSADQPDAPRFIQARITTAERRPLITRSNPVITT